MMTRRSGWPWRHPRLRASLSGAMGRPPIATDSGGCYPRDRSTVIVGPFVMETRMR